MNKKTIIANFKMNKTDKQVSQYFNELIPQVKDIDAIIGVAPSFVSIKTAVKKVKDTNILVGAQNMNENDSGAYTGEISPSMLTEIGVKYVVIGHSERREYFAETDETVNKKVKKAIEHGITPIMCCGETLAQRELGIAVDFIRTQIKSGLAGVSADDVKKVVIAYEPIWAIGTGKTATSEQAEEICAAIRTVLGEVYGAEVADEVRIQYGGSVNGKNAAELFAMPNIDGGLVGGASLKEEFSQIVNY